jgi:hypothetical protein
VIQQRLIEKMKSCLQGQLDDLCDPSVTSRGLPALITEWQLPQRDRDALIKHGVPVDPQNLDGVQLVGDVQPDANPLLQVNAQPAYRLGSHWWRDIVALAGSIFGGQFGIVEGCVVSFSPETGEITEVADSMTGSSPGSP